MVELSKRGSVGGRKERLQNSMWFGYYGVGRYSKGFWAFFISFYLNCDRNDFEFSV